MPQMTNAQLLSRVRELEAKVVALQAAPAAARESKSWPRTLLATILIVAGTVLAPVSVVATWTRAELTDSDRFVATFAPLASDPAVQDFVTDQVVTVIAQQIDIPALTSEVIDGITDLGTGPAATRALNAMKGPAASGLQSLVASTVQRLVTSDAFADVWATALRLSHTQLIAVMQDDPDAVVDIADDGSVGIQLAPIVDAVKTALLKQGFEIAARIPTVNRTIVIAQSDALPTVERGYVLAVTIGTWLPWIALSLLAAGVIAARRRSRALLWAAAALAFAMAVTLIALAVGALLFPTTVSPSVIPTGVANVLYETLVGRMRDSAVAVLVVAVVVAAVGWFAGPFSTPRKIRGLLSSSADRIRAIADSHGITTGRVGTWLYTQRLVLRTLVAVVAAGVVLVVRPITPTLVLGTLLVSALVIAILELAQRPPVTPEGQRSRQPDPVREDIAGT